MGQIGHSLQQPASSPLLIYYLQFTYAFEKCIHSYCSEVHFAPSFIIHKANAKIIVKSPTGYDICPLSKVN